MWADFLFYASDLFTTSRFWSQKCSYFKQIGTPSISTCGWRSMFSYFCVPRAAFQEFHYWNFWSFILAKKLSQIFFLLSKLPFFSSHSEMTLIVAFSICSTEVYRVKRHQHNKTSPQK